MYFTFIVFIWNGKTKAWSTTVSLGRKPSSALFSFIYWWKYKEKRQVIHISKATVILIPLLPQHLLNLQLIILFHHLLKSCTTRMTVYQNEPITLHNKNDSIPEWTNLKQWEFSASSEEYSTFNTNEKELPHCYTFIGNNIFKSVISLATWCLPQIATINKILTSKQHFQKEGSTVEFKFCFYDSNVPLKKSFYTSKEVKRDVSGINAHEINYRSIIARWETGKGHTALSTFSGLMNLPPPPM